MSTAAPSTAMTATTSLPTASAVQARRGGENFPVALRLLPARHRRHLTALYGYARLVDDVGDELAGDRHAALDAVGAQLDALFAHRRPTHPTFVALATTVHALGLPRDPFDRLLAANRADQGEVDLADLGALLAYCRLSAAPVGELVLRVFGAASDDRLVMSDRICAALQLVEHVQDVAEDAGNGRVYLPGDARRAAGVTRADLLAVPAPPAVRRVAADLAAEAERMLDEGAPLVATLRGYARVAVAGYVAGGRAALRALRADGFRHLDGRIHPRPRDVASAALAATVRGR